MKVMGSATLLFEMIVIALTIPVSVAIYEVPKSTAMAVAILLILLCIFALGAMRKDRHRAVLVGSAVQVAVLIASYFINPLIVPGVLFTLIWLLSVKLSGKLPS